MSEGISEREAVSCPICGADAEVGCIYGRNGWFRLRWRAGEPSFAGCLETTVGGGEPVGGDIAYIQKYASGIRCLSCRRIILDL